MGKLDGKVALITGGARGQGRSHALRLAGEGADIVTVDICRQIASVPYPMASSEDLAETVREVEALDRRIVAREADVRDSSALADVVAQGLAEFGHIDILVANAGISCFGNKDASDDEMFRDTVEVNLVGTWNTLHAVTPHMIERGQGGSVILTSSTQGLTGRGGDGTGGAAGYTASKHGVVGLMRSFAAHLAPHMIRVNSVHPTGVATPMILNDWAATMFSENPDLATLTANLMPVDMVDPIDISNAVLWLASDESRYVTGVALPVDAGFAAR